MERDKLERLVSQYRNHIYDSTDDPEELKKHLVFNEAQYCVRIYVCIESRRCVSTMTI